MVHKMSDVFISYKREEQPFAALLAKALEKRGLEIWWDPQLQAGEYFDDVIERALLDAACVVVVWSKRSVQSRFVKDEATYALNEGKLVPIQIEDVHLPFRFANIHTVSLIGWTGSEDDLGFKKMVHDISVVLNSSPSTRDDRKPKESLSSVRASLRHSLTDGESESDLKTGDLPQESEFCDELIDGSHGPVMVKIPPGTFSMGDEQISDANPVHRVEFPKAFAIGKYLVTFQEYDHFASITNRDLPDDRGWGRYQRPVINVSWHDAIAYATWLSEQTGARYRLPNESEWEYAARAGTTTSYWWGNDIHQYGAGGKLKRYFGFSRIFNRETTPVGAFPANPFGLFDTAGNVFEWTQDCWHKEYRDAPTDGSPWLETENGDCGLRVLRGGAWDANASLMRSAARHKAHPGLRYAHIGFRLVRDL
jgi:formylglycine-generating enzyme required for sulfatase activity